MQDFDDGDEDDNVGFDDEAFTTNWDIEVAQKKKRWAQKEVALRDGKWRASPVHRVYLHPTSAVTDFFARVLPAEIKKSKSQMSSEARGERSPPSSRAAHTRLPTNVLHAPSLREHDAPGVVQM